MAEPQATRTATVRNPRGMHLRPWGRFAELAGRYQARIEVINGSVRVAANSLMDLLLLAAGPGDRLEIYAVGPDAEPAAEALAEYLESLFEDLDSNDPPAQG